MVSCDRERNNWFETVDIIIYWSLPRSFGIKISKAIAVFLHVLPMLRDGQTDKPNKVDQQERPVHWNQKYLEPGTDPRCRSYQKQALPEVKLVY